MFETDSQATKSPKAQECVCPLLIVLKGLSLRLFHHRKPLCRPQTQFLYCTLEFATLGHALILVASLLVQLLEPCQPG